MITLNFVSGNSTSFAYPDSSGIPTGRSSNEERQESTANETVYEVVAINDLVDFLRLQKGLIGVARSLRGPRE